VESEGNTIGAAGRGVAARLIVCERNGRWAVALRRELTASGVRVWETRTLAGCREELEQSPASFVVLEVAGDLPGLLRFLVRQSQDFPAARLAAVAAKGERGERREERGEKQGAPLPSPLSPLPSPLPWLLREAGAVHFVDSLRQVGPLARLACRHLAQVPPPQQSLTERIWANLPWGEGRGERGEDEKVRSTVTV
jgi:hypothetical protein